MIAIPMESLPVIATGLAAATCLTVGPLFRNRQLILLAQLAAGLCFAAHYAGMGIAVACAVNILGAVQTAAALGSARSGPMNALGYGLIGLMILVGLWFWQGPISLLSVAAMTLIALARMQTSQVWLRALLIAGGCFWVAHDIIGQAWIALAADIGALVTGALGLLALYVRVNIEWRPHAVAQSA